MDLLVVFSSILQHHSSDASILWRSAFFMVQLSHPYMTTGKTMALTTWTFDKVMSLIFYMLSHHFLNESQFLDRLIRSPGSSRRRKGSGAPKERGVQDSQGGEKDKCFFLHCFVSVNIKMYLSRGHVPP